jgi:hypothetical protein
LQNEKVHLNRKHPCCLAAFVCQQDFKNVLEISGQAMTDMGYNFNQVNPDYFDVMRPTQLPAFKNQYGPDGTVFYGVRQSMLGLRSLYQTPLGVVNMRFAFDLFGVGKDAGQTTFHLLYAYAELGLLGVGYNWSLFCDFDAFPNIMEYWGPWDYRFVKMPRSASSRFREGTVWHLHWNVRAPAPTRGFTATG